MEVHYLLVNNNQKAISTELQSVFDSHFHHLPLHTTHQKRLYKKKFNFLENLGLLKADKRFNYQIDAWYHDEISILATQLHRQYHFDVVVSEYIYLSKVLECFPKEVLKIIDTHDKFSDRWKVFRASKQHPKWFSTSSEGEATAFNRADVILAIQEHEKQYFGSLTDKKVVTVGHWMKYQPIVSKNILPQALFLGSNDIKNVSSLTFFLESVLPIVRQQIPNFKVIIVGKISSELSQKFTDPLLEWHAQMPNLEDIYSLADIVINPSLFGTGLKIKTIEALSFGKYVITTSSGASGLENENSRSLYMEDQPQDFADKIVAVYLDNTLRQRMDSEIERFNIEWNSKQRLSFHEVLKMAPKSQNG